MVSHYKQATLLDCGMACVKTIISYYFPKLEHLDSLQFDNNNHQGLSLFDIEDILKSNLSLGLCKIPRVITISILPPTRCQSIRNTTHPRTRF